MNCLLARLIDLSFDRLIDWSVDRLIDWSMSSLIDWLIDQYPLWLIDWLILMVFFSFYFVFFLKTASLPGVLSVQEPHFWTLCTNHYVGNLKLEVAAHVTDPRYILSATKNIFQSAGIRDMYVQLEYSNM